MTHLLFFPQKSSCYKYKHTYLYHDISLLEYKVLSQWSLAAASSRLPALQEHKYFQTFFFKNFICISFPFSFPSLDKTQINKNAFQEWHEQVLISNIFIFL